MGQARAEYRRASPVFALVFEAAQVREKWDGTSLRVGPVPISHRLNFNRMVDQTRIKADDWSEARIG